MIIRTRAESTTVDWGNGLSTRYLVKADGMGYTIAETTVRAGTKSRLEYPRHLESCLCVAGEGEVIDTDGTSHRITPGTLYALDKHDPHFLVAAPYSDLRLISVFNPPLHGDERHSLDSTGFSQY
ncbi:ectoine synthase [Saccharopolyspora sp. 5N708]|uniref:ectoine synthase n=1 Tax=Saccharopolyspora sp. 5N708 TaxID=3457424 RepID=UPI003FD03CC9